MSGTVVVVSHYDRRSRAHVEELFSSMEENEAGAPFQVCLVVNRTSENIFVPPASRFKTTVLYRPNTGMNIGAWEHGWRAFPDADNFVFLQDECYVVRAGWLRAYLDALAAGAGMVGEFINAGWEKSWDDLRVIHRSANLPEHDLAGAPANRVDVYLDFFARHGIEPGSGGGHLQSTVWALRRDTLEAIGGFPIGLNYGECIAAEIGTAKRVEACGRAVLQLRATPFHFIRHIEWNQDFACVPFTQRDALHRRIIYVDRLVKDLQRDMRVPGAMADGGD
jgi:hypothetical protein